MVTAGNLPLLLVDIVDESFKFLPRFTATHGLVLPATFHESARSAEVLGRRGTLPPNAHRVPFGWIDRQSRFYPDVVNPAVADAVVLTSLTPTLIASMIGPCGISETSERDVKDRRILIRKGN
jgi:hypothetical protein